MESNLYFANLQVNDCKGISIITAYYEIQAKEIADEYWQGYKEYNGNIEITQISRVSCQFNVAASLKSIAGNTLE